MLRMPKDERYRALKRKHQQLLRRWRKNNGPCIICGEGVGSDGDHLPPKVLYPESMRNPKTEFFTFPVCRQCNGNSSDQDFLFSVLLSIGLNQESILTEMEPTDPDLLALYNQARGHLEDRQKAEHRKTLLQGLVGTDPRTGRPALDINKVPIDGTLTKIVRSIYWLYTEGDILQTHEPGWWILPRVDTFRTNYIEKHLKTSHADVHWEGRFIANFSFGHPRDGAGGFISCSLHFYTEHRVGKGMSWHVIGAPRRTAIDGVSLYAHAVSHFGPATSEQ